MIPSRIKKLEDLHITWELKEHQWNQNYSEAKEYFQRNGDLLIPDSYITVTGINLGIWVANQRSRYNAGKLPAEKVALLEEIRMIWNPDTYIWDQNYEAAKAYFDKEGDLLVPGQYVTESGLKLGSWILAQRKAYHKDNLGLDRVAALKKIGMIWDVDQYQWDIVFSHLQAYKSEFNTIKVPAKFLCVDGYSLAEWVNTQKRAYKAGRLKDQRLKKLLEIGFQF